jgi:hypothetical protein
MLALAPAGVALFVLVAHVGIGLQLKNPKIRGRSGKRRAHWATAITIIVMVFLHVFTLLRA